jgi:hypothetical protein
MHDYRRGDMLMRTGTSTPSQVPAEPTWRVDVRDAERLVVVTAGGPFRLRNFLDMAADALTKGSERGITRFVFDDRLIRAKLATSEIYHLTEGFERVGWKRGMRVAVVYPREHRSADDFQFFANLAVARAFTYSLFDELEPAIAWATAGE